MLVRPAAVDDATEMGRVFVDSFRAGHRGQMPEHLLMDRTYEKSARGWARSLREISRGELPGVRICVAVDDDGALMGVGMCGPPHPWEADRPARLAAPTGEVWALYVAPERQGRGAGRAMVSHLADFLVSQGIRRLIIGVLVDNTAARGFYERLGGRRIGVRDHVDEDVVLDEAVYEWPDITIDLR
jgi:ribosomal protein S18 acetylase RimI-like enzyme